MEMERETGERVANRLKNSCETEGLITDDSILSKTIKQIYFNQGFETKLVGKRHSVGREFVQLSVLTKHSGIRSVPDNAGWGECSIQRQDVGRSLSRASITFWKVA